MFSCHYLWYTPAMTQLANFSFLAVDSDFIQKVYECVRNDAHADAWSRPFFELSEAERQEFTMRQEKVSRCIRVENQDIGWIALSRKDDGTAHIAYGLFPEFRGKGLMQSAINQYLSTQVKDLQAAGFLKIIASVLPENLASIHTLESIGFRSTTEKIVQDTNLKKDLKYLVYEMTVSDFCKLTR